MGKTKSKQRQMKRLEWQMESHKQNSRMFNNFKKRYETLKHTKD